MSINKWNKLTSNEKEAYFLVMKFKLETIRKYKKIEYMGELQMIRDEFSKNIEWLYKHDYEGFRLIKSLIVGAHRNKEIKISRKSNTNNAIVTINIGCEVYSRDCLTEDGIIKIIGIVEALKKEVREAV